MESTHAAHAEIKVTTQVQESGTGRIVAPVKDKTAVSGNETYLVMSLNF